MIKVSNLAKSVGLTAVDKLLWLLSHPVFRRHPFRVSWHLAKWEWIRKSGRATILQLDNLCIKARPFDGMGRLICYFGQEADEMFKFMEDYLKPGMAMVDVGANIGTHAIYGARLIGPGGKVLAFEADPATAEILRHNIALNGSSNVVVFQNCISDKSGTVDFNINIDSAKSSIIQTGASKVSVLTCRLADILPREFQIDFLKIDVEGADYLVLLGALAIFKERPPAVVVVEATLQKKEICEFLSSYGYQLFDYKLGKLSPLDSQDGILNIYALRSCVLQKGEQTWDEPSSPMGRHDSAEHMSTGCSRGKNSFPKADGV
jgi:FkbM family methyltransferase